MSKDEPTPIDAMDQLRHDIVSGLNGRIYGIIMSPGKIPGTYNVQPARRGKLRSGGKFDHAPCFDVPVLWPRMAGMIITGRFDPGDEVDLVVYDREIDTYRLTGGMVDPKSSRMHSTSDVAIDFGGLASLKKAIKPPAMAGSQAELWIGKEDGSSAIRLQINGPLITIGSMAATEFVLLGTTLAATAQALQTVLLLTPEATDPATVIALANANNVAILGLLQAIQLAVAEQVIAS